MATPNIIMKKTASNLGQLSHNIKQRSIFLGSSNLKKLFLGVFFQRVLLKFKPLITETDNEIER